MGEINSLCFTNNDRFAISTKMNPSLFWYDMSGKQILHINKQGRAEYEYINPAIVRSDEEGNIYVWCNMSLKLIVFDKSGNPIDEIPYRKAIRDFLPYRDYLCFYLSGGEDTTIEVYDRSDSEIVLSTGKNPSQEHILLSLNETSGGMALLGSRLLFAYADEPVIHTIDLENLVKDSLSPTVKDPDFNVSKINGTARYIINGSRDVAMKYLSENSVVNGIYVTQDRVLIKVTTGGYEINRDFSIQNDNRMNKIYVLDHDLHFLYAITRNYTYGTKDKWFSSDGEDLYYIEFVNSDSDALNYTVNKLNTVS